MQLHFALVPDPASCIRLRDISARAAASIGTTDFILTGRHQGRARVALPHVTVLSAEIEDRQNRFIDLLHRQIQYGRGGKPMIPPGLLRAIKIPPRSTTWVEDYGYLQLNTPHEAIRAIQDLLVQRVIAFAKSHHGTILSPTGDEFRPHITLTHAANAADVAKEALRLTEQHAWHGMLSFASLEVCTPQKFGTFKGGKKLVNC